MRPGTADRRFIEVRGARENNLKDVSLDTPKQKITVFTGVSGSGKRNTVVLIEHLLDVIRQADWIIDLGPEGGSGGGNVMYEGPPEGLKDCGPSTTAGRPPHRSVTPPRRPLPWPERPAAPSAP